MARGDSGGSAGGWMTGGGKGREAVAHPISSSIGSSISSSGISQRPLAGLGRETIVFMLLFPPLSFGDTHQLGLLARGMLQLREGQCAGGPLVGQGGARLGQAHRLHATEREDGREANADDIGQRVGGHEVEQSHLSHPALAAPARTARAVPHCHSACVCCGDCPS